MAIDVIVDDVFVGVRMTSLPVFRQTFAYLSLNSCPFKLRVCMIFLCVPIICIKFVFFLRKSCGRKSKLNQASPIFFLLTFKVLQSHLILSINHLK